LSPCPHAMFIHQSDFHDVGHRRAITTIRRHSLPGQCRGHPGAPRHRPRYLAKSFALHGERPIVDPEEIRPVLERGLKVVKQGRLALIGTVTQTR
jgi:hypothetical protein